MRAPALLLALFFFIAVSITAQAQNASVKADFQPVADGSITIAQVVTPVDGFLVVRLPKNNKPMYGTTLAAVPLKAGTHKNIKVKLNAPVKPGATLAIMLHKDDGTLGKYEFVLGKKTDMPVFNGRRPVIAVVGITE